ncbi:MAG: tryptophan-rich sensory protein [Winogradskyella sp.]|nr:tryptophan-rich sensory protein [Winogradskyella sp.]NNL83459.1 tryptophan-rich sensory protein [Winogradskyella sp.]
MKRLGYTLLFLVINFGGLALGSWLMDGGSTSAWYLDLNKAPWTPPGWVFGVAWSLIMICFSIYLSFLFTLRNSTYVYLLFILQFILNVGWNYVFFNQQLVGFGLATIVLLTLLIAYLFISFGDEELSKARYLLVPYILWLCIATSLNAYILLNN